MPDAAKPNICGNCGHPAERHWTMGAHLCSVNQGAWRSHGESGVPCGCPGLLLGCNHDYVPILNGTVMWCSRCDNSYEIEYEDA